MKRGLKHRLNNRRLQLLLTAVVFGVVGSLLLWRSFAAGPIEILQPEQGTSSGRIGTYSDGAASGGSYVQFGAPTSGGSDKLPAHVRIMSLGDSVSYGAMYADAYRQFLLDKMQAVGGHTFSYVGSVRGYYGGNQTYWNEGHSGWCIELPCVYSTEALLPNIPGWLAANPADLIIVNGGINDISTGRSFAQAQASMQKMLEKIREVAPQAFVVVLPTTYGGTNWGDAFAIWLDGYVQQRQAAGERIYHADTRSLTSMQYFAPDTVHPNEAGYRAFADVIFGVVQPLL